MENRFYVDESLIIKEIPKDKKKRYNLRFEIRKAIQSGAFFGLQEHGARWLSGALAND